MSTDPSPHEAPAPSLAAIARDGGTFAMVAMDQRESLRTMFADASEPGADDTETDRRPSDDRLVRFKLDVASALGPSASGFLVDSELGVAGQLRSEQRLPGTCGLILAADRLDQAPGQPVEDTELDDDVVGADLTGVAALKLLVVWRRDGRRQARAELAHHFTETAGRLGVLSVLEPVVRATPAELAAGTWDGDEAIREAAAELTTARPSLYKAQVPSSGRGSPAELGRSCERLGAVIDGPWVVLSQGVALPDFPGAVAAACSAGASGFLAGRALWSDVVGAPDVPGRLREVAVPRLEALVETVDTYGRPWWQA